LGGDTYSGIFSRYGSGGYYIDLSLEREEAIEQISFLKKNLWVTRGTRAIFFDLDIYNPDAATFIIMK
jgi:hypothetical protein